MQVKRMKYKGTYSHVRKYFVIYLMLFTFQCLMHFFHDLEPESIQALETTYKIIDRLVILGMCVVAYMAYQRIK